MISVRDEVQLTRLLATDLDDLVHAINDQYIHVNTLNIPFPYTMNDARDFLHRTQVRREEAGFTLNWSIKIHDVVQGGIGMLCNDGYESHRTEIGYWMASAFRKRGIMTDTIHAFVNYIFDELHFTRLQANTLCDNIPSQRVLEKNGFIREGLLRKYFKTDDEYVDVYCYSRLHPAISD